MDKWIETTKCLLYTVNHESLFPVFLLPLRRLGDKDGKCTVPQVKCWAPRYPQIYQVSAVNVTSLLGKNWWWCGWQKIQKDKMQYKGLVSMVRIYDMDQEGNLWNEWKFNTVLTERSLDIMSPPHSLTGTSWQIQVENNQKNKFLPVCREITVGWMETVDLVWVILYPFPLSYFGIWWPERYLCVYFLCSSNENNNKTKPNLLKASY